MTTTDTKGIHYFASAIRQLSSLCCHCWEFHHSVQVWPFINPQILVPKGSNDTYSWLSHHPELKCVTMVTVIMWFQNHPVTSGESVSCWRVRLLHKPSFLFALVCQTGCGMWIEQRIPLGVGRKGGWLPRLGYSGKEGVTFLFVRIKGWQAQWTADLEWVAQGSLGSFAPIITFAAAGAGLSGRTVVGKTSPMMYAPQACWTFSWSWMGTMRLVLRSTVAWLHSMNEWV